MKYIPKWLASLLAIRLVPTYKVTYAPLESRNPANPIQTYTIAGKPQNLAWKSSAGHRLFTGYSPKSKRFISFRADRTLSINFAGFAFLTPTAGKSYLSTLSTPAPVAA